MPDKDGVEIYKRFYPWPESFRLGDPVLVKSVTDMAWPEFIAAQQAQQELIREKHEAGEEVTGDEIDQVVLAGLIAVAFWQGNPQMTRDKARRAVERIPQEEIEIIGSDESEADAGPPAVPATAVGDTPSPTSSGSADSPEAVLPTEILQDSTLDETGPNGSGVPSSPSVLPESLQA